MLILKKVIHRLMLSQLNRCVKLIVLFFVVAGYFQNHSEVSCFCFFNLRQEGDWREVVEDSISKEVKRKRIEVMK